MLFVSLDMSSLQISGFTWGIWVRYTVMAAFKGISIQNCAGGVSLARSDAAFGANDATSTVRAARGRLSALSVSHRKSILYGAFARESRAVDGPFRRFPARAVRLECVDRGARLAADVKAILAAPCISH